MLQVLEAGLEAELLDPLEEWEVHIAPLGHRG